MFGTNGAGSFLANGASLKNRSRSVALRAWQVLLQLEAPATPVPASVDGAQASRRKFLSTVPAMRLIMFQLLLVTSCYVISTVAKCYMGCLLRRMELSTQSRL